jgi:hypothetical protein
MSEKERKGAKIARNARKRRKKEGKVGVMPKLNKYHMKAKIRQGISGKLHMK